MARVSACEPLCAILLAKASVYPLSPTKANVGRSLSKFADRPDGYRVGGRIYRFVGRGREKET